MVNSRLVLDVDIEMRLAARIVVKRAARDELLAGEVSIVAKGL